MKTLMDDADALGSRPDPPSHFSHNLDSLARTIHSRQADALPHIEKEKIWVNPLVCRLSSHEP